jgi:hypothetical protein
MLGSSPTGAATKPGRPPGHYTPADVKKRLYSNFGTKTDAYLEALAKFLNGVISKVDFDTQLSAILSDGQRKLHNLFILTILRAASSTVVPAQVPTLTSAKYAQPTHYMPRVLDHARTRDLKTEYVWERISTRLSSKSLEFQLNKPNYPVVHMITLAYEQYVKMIAAMIATPGKKRDLSNKLKIENEAMEEEEEGGARDFMDVEEIGSTTEERNYNQGLASIYSHGDDVQILVKPRETTITADRILATSELNPNVLHGHYQEFRLMGSI